MWDFNIFVLIQLLGCWIFNECSSRLILSSVSCTCRWSERWRTVAVVRRALSGTKSSWSSPPWTWPAPLCLFCSDLDVVRTGLMTLTSTVTPTTSLSVQQPPLHCSVRRSQEFRLPRGAGASSPNYSTVLIIGDFRTSDFWYMLADIHIQTDTVIAILYTSRVFCEGGQALKVRGSRLRGVMYFGFLWITSCFHIMAPHGASCVFLNGDRIYYEHNRRVPMKFSSTVHTSKYWSWVVCVLRGQSLLSTIALFLLAAFWCIAFTQT